MKSPDNHTIFGLRSAYSKAPSPVSERAVHSTLFSIFDVADHVANLAPGAAAKQGLLARWDAWRAARKSARE